MGGEEGYFGERVAATYDAHSAGMFDPAVLEPAVERLVHLAEGGAALEFAIGTGRIALPSPSGACASRASTTRRRCSPGCGRRRVPRASRRSPATWRPRRSTATTASSTSSSTRSSTSRRRTARSRASRTRRGTRKAADGSSIEARVPELQRIPFGNTVLPWRADATGLTFYVYDVVAQRLSGQHYYLEDDGSLRPSPTEMRYTWPSELDLMARIAGMRLEHRWGGWREEPFTALSPSHVLIYRKR